MILIDKKGSRFQVKSYRPEDYSLLEDMYENFSPKARFQGMPPREKDARVEWIKGLIAAGDNFLAWREERVIGHAVVLPDFEKGDAEYLIFVNQDNRCRGVGKALTRIAIQRAENLGLKTVWLSVGAYNFRATNLYKKCGFSFCDPCSSDTERMMEYTCECENDT